jgi:hypothetical protein
MNKRLLKNVDYDEDVSQPKVHKADQSSTHMDTVDEVNWSKSDFDSKSLGPTCPNSQNVLVNVAIHQIQSILRRIVHSSFLESHIFDARQSFEFRESFETKESSSSRSSFNQISKMFSISSNNYSFSSASLNNDYHNTATPTRNEQQLTQVAHSILNFVVSSSPSSSFSSSSDNDIADNNLQVEKACKFIQNWFLHECTEILKSAQKSDSKKRKKTSFNDKDSISSIDIFEEVDAFTLCLAHEFVTRTAMQLLTKKPQTLAQLHVLNLISHSNNQTSDSNQEMKDDSHEHHSIQDTEKGTKKETTTYAMKNTMKKSSQDEIDGELPCFFDAQTPLSGKPWSIAGTDYMIAYLLHHSIQAVSCAWNVYQDIREKCIRSQSVCDQGDQYIQSNECRLHEDQNQHQNLNRNQHQHQHQHHQYENVHEHICQVTSPTLKAVSTLLCDCVVNLGMIASNITYLELRSQLGRISSSRIDRLKDELTIAHHLIDDVITRCTNVLTSSTCSLLILRSTKYTNERDGDFDHDDDNYDVGNVDLILKMSNKVSNKIARTLDFIEATLSEWNGLAVHSPAYNIWYCAYHRPRHTYEHMQAVSMKHRWEKRKPWIEVINAPQSTSNMKQVLNGHVHPVTCIAYSPNGSLLASGSQGDSVRIWDINTGEFHANMQIVCSPTSLVHNMD